MFAVCATQVTPSLEVSTVPPCPTAIKVDPLKANAVKLMLLKLALPTEAVAQFTPLAL